MNLYIIRHGETLWNRARRLQGKTDIPLAEEGIRLAKETGMHMSEIPFDVVFTSPLIRARETARYVLAGREIPVIPDARIEEICFGKWEGECVLNSRILPKDFQDRFFHDPANYICPPGGETFQEVYDRTGDFCKTLLGNPDYTEANILVSTHGCAGRCLLNHFYEDKTDIWCGGVPPNCAVTIVEVKDGRSRIVEKDKLYYAG